MNSMTRGPYMGATLEDKAAALASNTMSQAMVKFVATPQGKEVITKVTTLVAIPMFATGLFVGWLLFRKRGA